MAEPLRDRLRAALKDAMRARDEVARDALRTALGAIDNAEAVAVVDDGAPAVDGPIAGAVRGVGASEVPRLEVTEAQIADLLREQVVDRRATAEVVEQGGQGEAADRLRAEAELLETFLDPG